MAFRPGSMLPDWIVTWLQSAWSVSITTLSRIPKSRQIYQRSARTALSHSVNSVDYEAYKRACSSYHHLLQGPSQMGRQSHVGSRAHGVHQKHDNDSDCSWMTAHRRSSTTCAAFWNASSILDVNGLTIKRIELENFTHRFDLDVVLVCETHLKPHFNPKIANYTLHRRDSEVEGEGGDTAIYVKRNIDHSSLGNYNLECLEVNAVSITMAGNKKLTISAVYQRPSENFIIEDLETLFSPTGPTISTVDFNSKKPSRNSRLSNRQGRQLFDFAKCETQWIRKTRRLRHTVVSLCILSTAYLTLASNNHRHR